MPRVTFVKSARKDYPGSGIKKGESYYWWAFMQGGRGGPKIRSKTKPKPSQLTRSEFGSAVLALGEEMEAKSITLDDLDAELQSVKDRLDEIRDDTQAKYDNLPEGFQNGELGEKLQNRIDSVQSAFDEIDSISTEMDSEPERDEENGESEDDFQERKEEEEQAFADEQWSEALSTVQNIEI